MIIPVKTNNAFYDIILERGSLAKCDEYIKPKGKALVVTDSGVPQTYAKTVSERLGGAPIHTFAQGEASKNFDVFKQICQKLLSENFTRKDCVVAVGGGVTGDMAGFAAACYMRGIDFYNIPTTVLSQVDSSIGGKTAIDLDGIKNIIGAFHQPKAVIIDPDVLATLDKRQIANGLAESIKMGATFDESLFALFEDGSYAKKIETVIEKSLLAKRSVVQQDEKEAGLRKALNFGHTVGHAIETAAGLGTLYHGECVGLGMLAVTDGEIRERIQNALKAVGLPTEFAYDKEAVAAALSHDKKASGKAVTLVRCKKIGEFFFEETAISSLRELI